MTMSMRTVIKRNHESFGTPCTHNGFHTDSDNSHCKKTKVADIVDVVSKAVHRLRTRSVSQTHESLAKPR